MKLTLQTKMWPATKMSHPLNKEITAVASQILVGHKNNQFGQKQRSSRRKYLYPSHDISLGVVIHWVTLPTIYAYRS